MIDFFLQPNSPTREMSGSPRRFANQGLVYLKEIQTLEEVQELSVKQAKDILAMNRVNFKGILFNFFVTFFFREIAQTISFFVNL